MALLYRYTLWPSLYATASPTPVEETWRDVCRRFDRSMKVYDKKDHAPGFGPYSLLPGRTQRRDESVDRVTLAVFDVDTGTEEQVEAAYEKFKDTERLLYTTYSHSPTKASFRLVLPLRSPLTIPEWQLVRAGMIKTYGIPADLKKCSGGSHFYYMPSMSKAHDRAGFLDAVWDTEPFDPRPLLPVTGLDRRYTFTVTVDESALDLPDEPDSETPVDLEPLRERLRARMASLAHRSDPASKEKSRALGALLRGEVLAEDGHRRDTTSRVAGMLAWALPDVPVSVLLHLIRPSLLAMKNEGSSLTVEEVRASLIRSMRKKRAADAQDQAFLDALKNASKARKDIK